MRPVRKPAPWWPVTGPTMQVLRMYALTRRTLASRSSFSMASMHGLDGRAAIGPPPKVVPSASSFTASAAFFIISSAAQGKPLPSALAW